MNSRESWAGARVIFVAAAAAAAMFALPCAPAMAVWEVEYYASSQVMPEDTATGWQLFNNGTGFQRSFSGNALYENTINPLDSSQALKSMAWQNTTGSFNFNTGFVMEARLKMVAATNGYDRWGGASISARGTNAYNMDIQVDPDRVNLGSIFSYVSYPMVTTDAFHTYRAESIGNVGKLYVDDVLRLQLPLSADNAIKEIYFGDQGWEGGEMYFDSIRYGSIVPEPTTPALLAAAGSAALMRRRRQSRKA
jgi:hypothetical protein